MISALVADISLMIASSAQRHSCSPLVMVYLDISLYVLLLSSIALALDPQPPEVRPNDVETFKSGQVGILNGTQFVQWIELQQHKGVKAVALRNWI